MLRITDVRSLPDYRLELRFNDGAEGVADVSQIRRNGVFEAWNDLAFFEKVTINPESGTVEWPGEIDLDTYVLYSKATGKTIEEVLESI